MTVADVSIVVLVALFAATLLPAFELGLAALAAAFLVGLLAGVPADDVTAGFPGDFVVLVVGVTALFAVAQLNGTLDRLLDLMQRLVGGRRALVAMVPFLIGAVLTALGTLPAAATAIVAPIALGLAARYRISPFVAAVLGITGIVSGLLSPLAVYGVSAQGIGDKLGLGLPASAGLSFLGGGLLTGIVVCAAFLLVGRRVGAVPPGRIGLPVAVDEPAPPTPDDGGRLGSPAGVAATLTRPAGTSTVGGRGARILTAACLAGVVVGSVGFDLNIGYLGITAALIQLVVLRLDPAELVARIPWRIVLLVGGLLTYVALMQKLGAFERISELLRVEGSPALSLLLLCYIAGVTSFAASSIAVFVTTMPLLPALVADGVSPVGGVLALALASVLVDINPLGITGGLILGSAAPEVRDRLFRQLLVCGLVSVAVAPALAWAAFGWW